MLALVRASHREVEEIRAANADSPMLSMLLMLRMHKGEAQVSVLNDLSGALLEQAGLPRIQWFSSDDYSNSWPLVLVVEDLPMQPDPDEINVPLTPAYEQAILAACRRRTSMDALLAWVLRAWADHGHEPTWLEAQWNPLASLSDWAEATHTDPTRLPYDEALRRSATWHSQFVTPGYRKPVRPALVLVRDADGWTLQRLNDRVDFIAEGTSMGHCVGGTRDETGLAAGDGRYWQANREGTAVFLSMRDPESVPWATLEFHLPQGGPGVFLAPGRGLSLVQVQGPNDREVPEGARARLRRMLSAAGLEVESRGPLRVRLVTPRIDASPQAQDRLGAVWTVPFSVVEQMRHGSAAYWPDCDVQEGVVRAGAALREERRRSPLTVEAIQSTPGLTWLIGAVQAELDRWNAAESWEKKKPAIRMGIHAIRFETNPWVRVVQFPIFRDRAQGDVCLIVAADGTVRYGVIPRGMDSQWISVGIETLADAFLIAAGLTIEPPPSATAVAPVGYPDLSPAVRAALLAQPQPMLVPRPTLISILGS